jgi:hypothetical protein
MTMMQRVTGERLSQGSSWVLTVMGGRAFGLRGCAACGAREGELHAGDDDGYILFCEECATAIDPLDPCFEVGGEG